jgi:hypothetical protein
MARRGRCHCEARSAEAIPATHRSDVIEIAAPLRGSQ